MCRWLFYLFCKVQSREPTNQPTTRHRVKGMWIIILTKEELGAGECFTMRKNWVSMSRERFSRAEDEKYIEILAGNVWSSVLSRDGMKHGTEWQKKKRRKFLKCLTSRRRRKNPGNKSSFPDGTTTTTGRLTVRGLLYNLRLVGLSAGTTRSGCSNNGRGNSLYKENWVSGGNK